MEAVVNKIMRSIKEGKDRISTEILKFRNRDFLQATIASAIYIFMAKGEVSPENKEKLFDYIQESDELKAFSQDEVAEVYNNIIRHYTFNNEIGNATALKLAGAIKSEGDEQILFMIRVACILAMRDGVPGDKEKEAVNRICRELGISVDKVLP